MNNVGILELAVLGVMAVLFLGGLVAVAFFVRQWRKERKK